MNLIKKILNRTPNELISSVKSKAFPSNSTMFSIESILNCPKQMRHSRMLDLLLRYDFLLKNRNFPFRVLEFNRKKVLELGCGPTMGFGPIAVFLGCDTYVSCEPMFNDEIRSNKIFLDVFLKKLHRDLLVPIFGDRLTFVEWVKKIENSVIVEKCTYLDMEYCSSYDYVISNSVLEHVSLIQIDQTINRLKQESNIGLKFLHDVDYGNHASTDWVFENLYNICFNEAREQNKPHINLLRCSDLLGLFTNANFECSSIPIVSIDNSHKNIHSSWSNLYDKDTLSTKTSLIVGEYIS